MSYYLGLSMVTHNSSTQGKAERQKLLSAEARRVLSQLVGKPLAQDDIAREKQGRPFLPGRDLDFSISHSGSLAAVSLVNGKNLRTGCDVELARPRAKLKEIADDCFSAAERDYIASHNFFDETRFYQIWTLKECYIKLKGLSVFDMVNVPSFIDEGNFTFCGADAPSPIFYLYELSGSNERSILATAVEGIEAEPEIRWFSQDSLACISIAKI